RRRRFDPSLTWSRPQAERPATAASATLHLPERCPLARFRASSARRVHCRGQDRRSRSNLPGGVRLVDHRQPQKDTPMSRRCAVALRAASVSPAPGSAQGGPPRAPPAKVEPKSKATPKAVTAKPTLKAAKVKPAKRYAHYHRHHVKHVAHVKPIKHVKSAHAVHGTKGTKQVHREISTTTSGQNGTMAPKAKSNVN